MSSSRSWPSPCPLSVFQHILALEHIEDELGSAVGHEAQDRVLESVIGVEELGQFTLWIAREDAKDERTNRAAADDPREQILLVQGLYEAKVESTEGGTAR